MPLKKKPFHGATAFYGVLLFCLLLSLIQGADRVMPAVAKSLALCYRTVIPSLFPFFVLSGMLVSGGFVDGCARALQGVMYPLFRVNGAGAICLVMGFLSGYPMGAKITAELYKKGALTRGEAEHLLMFCNNAGPLFVIGAIGAGVLGDGKWGLFLYGIHVFSALVVGLFFRSYRKEFVTGSLPKQTGERKQGGGFTTAVEGGVNTILLVCGFILFFAALTACFSPVLDKVLPPFVSLMVQCGSEITGGAVLLAEAGLSTIILLALLSFFLGFGGLCVMMQAKGMLSGTDLSIKPYCLGKLIQGSLSFFLVYALYPLQNAYTRPVFATEGIFWMKQPVFDKIGMISVIFLVVCCLNLCIKFKKIK